MKVPCNHSESVLYYRRRTERFVRLPGDTILILKFVQADKIRTDVRTFPLKIQENEQPQAINKCEFGGVGIKSFFKINY